MDDRTAYGKGWEASKRTRTYDLDTAEARFKSTHGPTFARSFAAGWLDYAADNERRTSFTVQDLHDAGTIVGEDGEAGCCVRCANPQHRGLFDRMGIGHNA